MGGWTQTSHTEFLRNFAISLNLSVIDASMQTALDDDDVAFSQHVVGLLRQIKLAVAPNGEVDAEDTASAVDDARGELERLRKDTQPAVFTASADRNGMCTLPALVPELPEGLRVTAEMKQLLALVLSPSKKRIGFCGKSIATAFISLPFVLCLR